MILITGATGQLGRAVVKQLAKRVAAERIGVFVRDERKAADLKEQGVKLFVGNYDDIASLDQAMRGVEKVLLISGTEQNRIQQHQNVVDAAQRAGVQLIAYTSRAVKGQDTASNPLMEGHFATEAYIKRSGLTYALLRNALYMDVIPLYLGGAQVFETSIYLPTGAGKVAFALRSELGEAIANLLADEDTASGIHQFTAGEAWSYYDVADVLTELSGRNVAYTPIEKPEFAARMRERGLPERMIQFTMNFHSEVRHDLLDEVSPEMEHLLGRRPASLKNGLKVLFNL
jgi:NAD(P)H dehydrogenase (quinone)